MTRRQTCWHGATMAVFAGVLCGQVLSANPSAPDSLVALGEQLFADRNLSRDGTVACASCHQPEYAFADPRPVSVGVGGLTGTRNAPSLLGVANRAAMTWDGRTKSLPVQSLIAFTHPRELALGNTDILLQRVGADPHYRAAFAASFGTEGITVEGIRDALTAYLGTLSTGESAYDRYAAGDSTAMSPAAQRGLTLFRGAAGCAHCHRIDSGGASFADGEYHRNGVGLSAITVQLKTLTTKVAGLSPAQLELLIAEDSSVAALGRYLVTHDPKDIGKYRTPSLRNVALTAPYMHDGSLATLEETVEHEVNYRALTNERPLSLTPLDKSDLVAFLHMLTGLPTYRSPNAMISR